MKDEYKIKRQLINELDALSQKTAKLEAPGKELKQVKGKINLAAKEWEITFNSITDLISIQDKDFKIVKANKALADTLEMKPEELIGKHCYEVLHGTKEPWPNCPFKQTLGAKKTVTEEFFEPRLGVNLEVSTSPIFNMKDKIVGSIHIAKDITERKQAEERLKKTTQDLKRAVRALKKANQKILEQQKLFVEEERLKVLLQMAGATAHELNQPLTVILPRMELSLAQVDEHTPIFKEMTIVYQHCVKMADLVKKISEISIHQTKPYVGNTEIIDIEEASHGFAIENIPHNLLESVLNALNHYSIIITDLSGKIIFFNKYSEELLGYSAKEVVNKKDVLFFTKKEVSYESIEDCRAPAIQKGYYEREKTIITKSGNEINIDLCFAPIKDRASQIAGFIGIAKSN